MKYLEAQMKMHEMYSNWWLHYANTEHNKTRIVHTGEGRRLTSDELVHDAIKTSKRHIELFIECMEHIND